MNLVIAVAGALLLLGVIIVLVKASARERIASWFAVGYYRIWLVPIGFLYLNAVLAYLTGTWDPNRFKWLIFYFFAPTLVLFLSRPIDTAKPRKLVSDLVDLGIVLLLWLPVEFDIVQKSWEIEKIDYPFAAEGAMIFAMIAYTGYRCRDLKLNWSFDWTDFKWILAVFAIAVVIILPIALPIGFAKCGLHPDVSKLKYATPLLFVAIWFMPALVEELIFRAVIQSVLVRWFKPAIGICIAALIFGAAHLDNKVHCGDNIFPVPNITYMAFATVAGIGYGLVYHKRSLQASATLHALVDFVWWLYFKG